MSYIFKYFLLNQNLIPALKSVGIYFILLSDFYCRKEVKNYKAMKALVVKAVKIYQEKHVNNLINFKQQESSHDLRTFSFSLLTIYDICFIK